MTYINNHVTNNSAYFFTVPLELVVEKIVNFANRHRLIESHADMEHSQENIILKETMAVSGILSCPIFHQKKDHGLHAGIVTLRFLSLQAK